MEQLLHRCRGDVIQAMDAMLSGNEDQLHGNSALVNSSFPIKSAFSPLVPSGLFGSPNPRYNLFQQHHSKRFLTAPYTGTGYMSSIIQSDTDTLENGTSTGGNESCDNFNENQD